MSKIMLILIVGLLIGIVLMIRKFKSEIINTVDARLLDHSNELLGEVKSTIQQSLPNKSAVEGS